MFQSILPYLPDYYIEIFSEYVTGQRTKMFAKLLFQQEKMFEERTVELYVLFVQIEYLAVMGIDIDEPVPEGTVPEPGSLRLRPFVHFSEGYRVSHVLARDSANNILPAVFMPKDPYYEVLVPVMGQHHRRVEHQRRPDIVLI